MDKELDIVKKYCGDIRERIHVCRNRHIAEMLRERLCNELDANCHSQVVLAMLRKQIDEIINETFDKNGINVYLED